MTTKMLAIAIAIIFMMLLNVLIVIGLTWPITEYSIAKAGALGDSFGWLNAAFSGLAFFGVIWTLLHQKEELQDARQTTRMERFEGTFFHLIGMMRKNLDEIRVPRPDGGQPVFGVEALSHYCRESLDRLRGKERLLTVPHGRLVHQQLLRKSAKCIPLQARYLGTLEALLELIERDLSTDAEREPYWSLVASQLTSAEAKYILLLCLRGKRNDRLCELVIRAIPILRRIEASNVSEQQRALFLRLYAVELTKRKDDFLPLFDPQEYKRIRSIAKSEMGAKR